jgi:hypothetical protein
MGQIVTPIVAADMRVLSEVVNKREKPFLALSQLLFPAASRRQLATPYVQIDEKDGSLQMAAFTKVGTKSIPVERRSGGSYVLQTPNINIHRPLTASEDLVKRMAGEPVFVGEGDEDVMLRHVEMTLVEDVEELSETIDMTEEWWVSQLLTGTVSYNVNGLDSFELDTGKDASLDYTVSTLWSAANPTPLQDLIAAQTAVRDVEKRAPAFTHGVMDRTAANAFRDLLETGEITVIKTDSGVLAGDAELRAAYEENGLRYLGTLTGSTIQLWEYDDTYIDFDGTTEKPMIRAGYVELFSLSTRAAQTRKGWYGAHEDINLIMKRMHLTNRVTFTTVDEDCGTLKQYMKARPFFWFTRPNYNCSIKVA